MLDINIYDYIKLKNGSIGIVSNVAMLRNGRLFKVESVDKHQRHVEAAVLEEDIVSISSVSEFLDYYEQDEFRTIEEVAFTRGGNYFG